MLTTLLFCALPLAGSDAISSRNARPLANSDALSLQIALDRAGFSVNTLDGQWGRKSQSALEHFIAREGAPASENDARAFPSPKEAYARYFASEPALFRIDTVTDADLAALVKIPTEPADKARLPAMGYESLAEMFAERGHLTIITLKRLNPGLDFATAKPGARVTLPDFPSWDDTLRAADRTQRKGENRPVAATVRVSLGRFEIAAYDKDGERLALFPCSIAKDKSKRPPNGELKITALVSRPNYTYTPDHVPKGAKAARHILPPGPNNPVGVAWIGLSLPGYGIHGTPTPERIGRAESHGCFRLANWNAARLYALCSFSTRVFIDP